VVRGWGASCWALPGAGEAVIAPGEAARRLWRVEGSGGCGHSSSRVEVEEECLGALAEVEDVCWSTGAPKQAGLVAQQAGMVGPLPEACSLTCPRPRCEASAGRGCL